MMPGPQSLPRPAWFGHSAPSPPGSQAGTDSPVPVPPCCGTDHSEQAPVTKGKGAQPLGVAVSTAIIPLQQEGNAQSHLELKFKSGCSGAVVLRSSPV